MTHLDAERNLLYGVLALQNDFLGREELVAAVSVWLLDKSKPLDVILREEDVLPDDEHALLLALVEKHLQRHDDQPHKSLASLGAIDTSVHQALNDLGDEAIKESLVHLETAAADDDLYPTHLLSVPVEPTSAGNRYRVLRSHAKGGLGEVSVALDQELNREVALKEIHQKYADHPEARVRFIQEAEITGGLEHPGIVPIYSLDTYADGRASKRGMHKTLQPNLGANFPSDLQLERFRF